MNRLKVIIDIGYNLIINRDFNSIQKIIKKYQFIAKYRALNLFPNLFVSNELVFQNLEIEHPDRYFPKLISDSAPPRFWSDLFFSTLPWQRIQNALGKINILEIGCGSGRYAEVIQNHLSQKINEYIGIDIKKSHRWKELEKKNSCFSFYSYSGNNPTEFISDKTNLIFSQSVIEHIEDHFEFFKKIGYYIKKEKRNILQIHLFPSYHTIPIYRYHGLRTFTPRTISKFTKIFRKFSYFQVYNLGGKYSFSLHHHFITKPSINKGKNLRKTESERYTKLLYNAVKKDLNNFILKPIFYALIIHSYSNNKIF